ncbi:MAG TPA: acyloxyacyl hydrolase [Nitrospirales bacterium]|nr:acyloxyacyl hydrolase [Nitrospirales bacterium]
MKPLLLAVAALVLFGTDMVCPSGSQADSPDARAIVQKGTVEAGLAAGYLQGLEVLTSVSSNRSAVYVLPRVGMVLTSEMGKGWFAGNLELLLEPLYAHYYQPFTASAAGGSLVFKYNFLSFGRWMPYWDLGLGMLWTNLAPRIPEQSTQFNFVLESGPGVHYFVTEKVAFMVGARFHHISNAGLGDRNLGLNSILGYAGVSVFLPWK